jgi:hypothetical protein
MVFHKEGFEIYAETLEEYHRRFGHVNIIVFILFFQTRG